MSQYSTSADVPAVMQSVKPAITTAAMDKKSVATRHPQYKAMAVKWRRCRDVAAGRDAVLAGGAAYLPKLHEQTPQAYSDYQHRATFYNATWRTVSALSGMLFRKPELVEVPDAMLPMLENINLKGEPLHLFAQQVALECITVGRVGLLVDYPPAADNAGTNAGPYTVARAQALGLRPMIQRYCAESIINWRTGPIDNVDTLLMVVLVESVEVRHNEFAAGSEVRYRVLDLAPDPQNPGQLAYRVRVFRINERTDEQEQVGADRYPLLGGKTLRTIPFVFVSCDDGLSSEVPVPPLVDLVDLNLAHYRVSADYEHGCHFTGLPTPFVTGYQGGAGEKLYVGSTNAWVFPDPSTQVGYLEFSGAGLGMLAANMDRKEQQMAALGARLLMADNAQVTATTAAIQHGGEASILAAVAQVLSLGITHALTLFAAWAGLSAGSPGADGQPKRIHYDINRDFFPVPMDSATLMALVAAWQAGAISFEVLFANLKKGEVIAPTADFEQEQAKIANAPPSSPIMDTK